ncbi:MAG TPA: VWA domain-containing protein, partial [Thermoanaerobaculia bacterium]
AIAAAIRKLKGVKQRKTVVVFTDGDDSRSRFSVEQVIGMARGSEVSIYAVAEVGAGPQQLRTFLDRLADETGGRFYPIGSVSTLAESFAAIVQELRSQYFLTYTPTDRRPRSWHTIAVKVNRPGVVVRAKKQYRLP